MHILYYYVMYFAIKIGMLYKIKNRSNERFFAFTLNYFLRKNDGMLKSFSA